MKIMYLDESGDHSLTSINPEYPVFVLGGIIVDQEYAEGVMAERVNQFKQEFFGREDIILHTADIARARNGFEALQDPEFRMSFRNGLNELMRTLDYRVVACVIKKTEHRAQYGEDALDPYFYSLHILVERFGLDIGGRGQTGIIVAERRDPSLDSRLLTTWDVLKAIGTRYFEGLPLRRRITDFRLKPKRDNIVGLQLADLVVSPIGRHITGKPDHEDFAIIEGKFRRNASGDYRGWGLVVLPKTE